MYTIKEIADRFNVHPETVRRWFREGKLKADKTWGRDLRVTEEALNAFLEANEKYGALVCSEEINDDDYSAKLLRSIEQRLSALRIVSDGLKEQQDYIQKELVSLESCVKLIKSKLGAL